ncbi:hypothetical protein Hanom_Chr11g01016981 [Helianthus anomalus]
MVGEKLSVSCDPALTPTLLIIFCGIQVKGKYGWRRFVLDGRLGFTDGWRRFVFNGRRGFNDYSTVVLSDGWRSGLRGVTMVGTVLAIKKTTAELLTAGCEYWISKFGRPIVFKLHPIFNKFFIFFSNMCLLCGELKSIFLNKLLTLKHPFHA